MARKPNTTSAGGTVRARVLTDCWLGQTNTVIELPADEAAHAQAVGVIDTDPAAVAYAEGLAS